MVVRRFLVPGWAVTVYGLIKWKARISARAEVEITSMLSIGPRTVISSFVKLKATGGPLRIGSDCGFAPGCFISTGAAGLEIGDHVIFGPNVSVIADNYRYEKMDVPMDQQGFDSKGIRIGRNVWIGANSVILDGSQIGDNSIVAAGSVVNRRFPPGCIIHGNPARVLLNRSRTSGAGKSEGGSDE